jgi:ribonucleoside-diphosphate reductase alpha chain
MIKIVNNTVPGALFKLGYKDAEVQGIVNYIDATGTIEGAPAVKPEHLAVFDCSFKPAKGTRSISWQGHVKMMAATQPFLSGAISKTVNLPTDCTAADIAEAYTEAWRLGLKAVAIYRDGSKGTQPLNVSMVEKSDKKSDTTANPGAPSSASAGTGEDRVGSETITALIAANAQAAIDASTLRDELASTQTRAFQLQQSNATLAAQLEALRRSITEGNDALDAQAPPVAIRHRLPAERASITHKFNVGGHEGYVTVGLYPNGQPGEMFVRMAKEGSTISGLMDSFATAASLCLQHGVPLKVLCEKFAHTRFEPSGWTGDEQIGYAKSLMDYLFRWMQLRFLSGHQLTLFSLKSLEAQPASSTGVILSPEGAKDPRISAPAQLSMADAVPVTGTVNAPDNTVLPHSNEPTNEPNWPSGPQSGVPGQPADWGGLALGPEELSDRRAPQQGIAPDLTASYDSSSRPEAEGRSGETPVFAVPDRGIYHAATAMKSMYNMGDAPSCSTCGSIMTRNGSCYRCMECGSTSGCS